MTAPNPALRIAPSGPPTTGSTDPLIDYAGSTFKSVNTSDASLEDLFFIAAPDATERRIARQNAPQAGTIAAEFAPVGGNADADSFSFGAGTWLVEAQLASGFSTDVPAATNATGVLRVQMELVNDANAVVQTVEASAGSAIGPKLSGAGPSVALYQAFFTITADQVLANGGPFKGVQVVVNRQAGNYSQFQLYDATSGDLFFWNDCLLSVRRFR